ncbi:2815_t:CDS:2, partial [Racocetra fulgida]
GTPFSASTDTTVDKLTDVNLDPALVLIFKRLSKRDTTTKLKALEELEAYLRGKEDNETDLGKFFVKLAIDVERRIRYATYTCHLLIVSKVKKRLASSLKEIIGVWIISLFDQYKDVARVAMESFQVRVDLLFVDYSLLKAAQQYDDLFDNPKTWANLTSSSPLVRKSCYNLIKVLTNKWPNRLDVFSTMYLMKIFNDKDITVYGDLWDSLLVFTK